jgi:hypothetical protein
MHATAMPQFVASKIGAMLATTLHFTMNEKRLSAAAFGVKQTAWCLPHDVAWRLMAANQTTPYLICNQTTP